MPQPKKTDYDHWLSGSDSQAKPEQPSAYPAGRPKMPKDLSPVAQQEWKRIVKLLATRGTLTKVDASALELYSETYARHRALLKELQEHGEMIDTVVLDSSGNAHDKRVVNPASKIATQLANSLRAWQKELGITPTSREKARPAAPERKAEHNEEFINIV